MADQINGLFELFGAAILWLNVAQLHRDKCVKGCDWRSVAFFTSWGCWNLYFYPAMGCWLSFVGAAALVVANATWLGMMAFYLRNPGRPATNADFYQV